MDAVLQLRQNQDEESAREGVVDAVKQVVKQDAVSALSRLSPGYLPAISRPSLGHLSAISRPPLGHLSAVSRPSLVGSQLRARDAD